MVRDKPLRASWERKVKERQERRLVRQLARQLQEGKQRQREVTGLRHGAWPLWGSTAPLGVRGEL